MATSAASLNLPPSETILRECAQTLNRMANFRLPQALDQRLLWLSENKEQLDESQRKELFALVELADCRALDKVQAQAVLDRLVKVYPDLATVGL